MKVEHKREEATTTSGKDASSPDSDCRVPPVVPRQAGGQPDELLKLLRLLNLKSPKTDLRVLALFPQNGVTLLKS